MRLSISHTTTYRFEEPVDYALQQLRLTPRAGHGQTVIEWGCDIAGGARQAVFEDQFSNTTLSMNYVIVIGISGLLWIYRKKEKTIVVFIAIASKYELCVWTGICLICSNGFVCI